MAYGVLLVGSMDSRILECNDGAQMDKENRSALLWKLLLLDWYSNNLHVGSFIYKCVLYWREIPFEADLERYIYIYRLEARNWHIPAILQALFTWAQIMCTVMVAWGVFRKKFFMSFLFVLLQWGAFSVACDKLPGLITCIMAVFVVICRYIKCSNIHYCFIGSEILIWLTKLLIPALDFYKYDLLNRRLMFTPQMLHTVYWDFFTKNDYNYFRSGFLRYFGFDGPYPMGIPRTIGSIYFNPDNAANNGLFSDAYSNLGDVGLFVMPILVVAFLKLCDLAADGLEWQLKLVAAVVLGMAFLSGAFVSIVILQGSIILLLLLFFPRIDDCC